MVERVSFSSLGLKDWLVKQVSAVGFKDPKPVQIHCIPPILKGKDCFGCAKTGSGKTAAFALPMLQKLAEDPYGIFGVVITPTRELAAQIADQFRVFGHGFLRDAVIIGGMDMMKQALVLARRPHIVIATPGRLADHLQSSPDIAIAFKKIKILVMDEADRLLDHSFEEDLGVIFETLPTTRQTLLFSATLTESLNRLRELVPSKPFYWEAPAEVQTVEELDQKYILMNSRFRAVHLIKLLQKLHEEEGKTMIVFATTCRSCQVYSMVLQSLELPCVALHSMMSQRGRLAALTKFKSGHVRILVATDVASRGLDIPSVQVVVNVDVPATHTDYIHRVGRTARAGREGLAISLVSECEEKRINNIESKINCKLSEFKLKEVTREEMDKVAKAKIEANQLLRRSNFGEQRAINKRKREIIEEIRKVRKLKRLKKKGN